MKGSIKLDCSIETTCSANLRGMSVETLKVTSKRPDEYHFDENIVFCSYDSSHCSKYLSKLLVRRPVRHMSSSVSYKTWPATSQVLDDGNISTAGGLQTAVGTYLSEQKIDDLFKAWMNSMHNHSRAKQYVEKL